MQKLCTKLESQILIKKTLLIFAQISQIKNTKKQHWYVWFVVKYFIYLSTVRNKARRHNKQYFPHGHNCSAKNVNGSLKSSTFLPFEKVTNGTRKVSPPTAYALHAISFILCCVCTRKNVPGIKEEGRLLSILYELYILWCSLYTVQHR